MEIPFCYQFRLILIGDSTVGKSSLLKYFTDSKFSELSDPTVGVDFFAHLIEVADGTRIKLQCWDTGKLVASLVWAYCVVQFVFNVVWLSACFVWFVCSWPRAVSFNHKVLLSEQCRRIARIRHHQSRQLRTHPAVDDGGEATHWTASACVCADRMQAGSIVERCQATGERRRGQGVRRATQSLLYWDEQSDWG